MDLLKDGLLNDGGDDDDYDIVFLCFRLNVQFMRSNLYRLASCVLGTT
jgi:hypothetical protein